MKNLQKNKGIVLFDGYCNLCSGSVVFIIKRDKKDYFRFVSVQSKKGKDLLLKFNLNVDYYNSVILIEGNKLFTKSDAVLKIAGNLVGIWRYSYYLIFIPRFIRDFFYDIIAANRYRWFGKKNSCYIPDKNINSKFI